MWYHIGMKVNNLLVNYIDFLTFGDVDKIFNNFLNSTLDSKELINNIVKTRTIVIGNNIEINFKINGKNHHVALTNFEICSSLLSKKTQKQANFEYRSYMIKKLEEISKTIAKRYRLKILEILHRETENEDCVREVLLERELSNISQF